MYYDLQLQYSEKGLIKSKCIKIYINYKFNIVLNRSRVTQMLSNKMHKYNTNRSIFHRLYREQMNVMIIMWKAVKD